MTVAINFDGHQMEADNPVGIDVATEQFLRAFFRHANQETFPVVCPDDTAFGLFRDFALDAGVDPTRCVSINQNDGAALAKIGALFRYDPGFIKHVWARRFHGQQGYSLAGIAHASSTSAVMAVAGQYVTAPTQAWDALICPSQAIKSAILNVVEGWQEYLGDRLNADRPCPMEFPVIPLGADVDKYEILSSDNFRSRQRANLGINPAGEDVVILFVGRLNFVAKANPLPLMIGLEKAAAATGKPIKLVFNGYFNDELSEEGFLEAAEKVCDLVDVRFIRHGDPDYPDGLWAGADIFCSLSDNIQESFGLTPVEAMASGLPVVVSDWDGYRDTVRDGVDGFSIPTMMPAPGFGGDLAYDYFARPTHYGDYLGGVQQSTAIDLEALVEALKKLIDNPGLRRSLGAAGHDRAIEKYNWPHIIAAYEDLWAELAQKRMTGEELAPRKLAPNKPVTPFHPSHPDPFTMFESFPTHQITRQGKIELATSNWADAMKLIGLKTGLVYADSLMDLEDLPFLIGHLESSKVVEIEELIGLAPQINPVDVVRTLAWLVKLGICRYRP